MVLRDPLDRVEATDWRAWHTKYEDPAHPLSRRLVHVRQELARLLAERRGRPTRVVSMCAGDGRDTLPVLAAGHRDVHAVLVEIDDHLASDAREEAERLRLPHVHVLTQDAGLLATYRGLAPADVLLACGVFGNISDDDLETTIASLPALISPGASVIWTRGSSGQGDPTSVAGDPADLVREVLARHGFSEQALIRPDDAGFRVGVHRYDGGPPAPGPERMFQFVR